MTERENTKFEFRVAARLTSHGVYVDEVVDAGGRYEVTYESLSADGEGVVPHREVGRVINVFRDLHDDDWRGADIDATVTDFDGVEQGRWHVESEWLDALHNGSLTEVEFSERVVGTIERTDT
ncbi:hypothetical protein [Salarchaeum sp. JOR-1]|uniref:hypothetical protein n=1 Tax=Salarchaeum sp. JOR-1 TaxID=2599399 RepID=UPI0011985DF5|nr:hypothetical protein [Salarchaeum sp. JOR-1]QDX39471.1 hypothetical protein FQU85_00730 [Salarchaeum sp. JOR-1]